MMYQATSTAASYSTATYGSGSSNWGGSSYNSCVQQCVASFGAPQATYMPGTATASSGSYGTGATHTVIVAPSQGVLRYVPFAVNASVGDTIKFMWGANNHTVTKSSELELCNKTSDAPFASGEQNKSFVFTQVVNDTNPTFFYCGTPTHCEKGMFGIMYVFLCMHRRS
jgi:plastocyanin